jgi:PAS domain S-box-containing protein
LTKQPKQSNDLDWSAHMGSAVSQDATASDTLTELSADSLTPVDLAALKEVAARLGPMHRELAADWSRRLLESVPDALPEGVTLPVVTEINATFFSLIFQHVDSNTLAELYQTYYDMNRRLIEVDLLRPSAGRSTLEVMYASARISLQVLEERLGNEPRLMLAYTKLAAHLMMLLGRAYSDCREVHIQQHEQERSVLLRQARDELEARVRERTVALTRLNDALAKEVGERRRAEQSLLQEKSFAEATLDSLPGVFYLFNREGRFLRWNKNFETVSEYSRAEIAGMSPLDFFHPQEQQLVAERIRDVFENGSATVEAEFVSKSGRHAPYFFTGRFVRIGDTPCVVGMGIDISERKHAEEALRERTEEVIRSNAELEQFAYVASHDLQEPLRAVATFAQLLDRRYGEHIGADGKGTIERVTAAVQRMQTLIRDLLAYSRLDTRKSDFRVTDCEVVLHDALDNLQTAITETGARVTHDPLPTLVADASQLRQLLQNLIGNALKFHGQRHPEVHIAATRMPAAWLFRVSDNGIGIDAEYFERIFVIFQRLHGQRAYPGTGVGLAICKKIVERHGGRIWVESKPGAGATFSFTLAEHRAT